jgi:hypothetical protein
VLFVAAMRPTIDRHALAASACALTLLACDPSPVTDDASMHDAAVAPDAPMDDAAIVLGPTDVHWERVSLDEAMPNVWGWSAASLGDGRTVVLGGAIGASAGTVLDRVLVLEPAADASLAITALDRPALAPAPRWCTCASFDAARGRVLFAGGRNESALEGLVGSTWELDPSDGSFRELTETPTPPGVIGCALAHATARRATYWFGGASATVVSGTTYRLDEGATTWVELDATGPTPRYDAHFEPLDDRRLLLFGGSYGARGAAFYSDVWIFDTETESWTEVMIDGATPPGRRTPWVRLTEDGRGFYAGFGYDGSMQPLGDLHHLDLERAQWTEIAVPEPIPAARGFSPAVEGPPGTIGLLLPGLGRNATVRDAFLLRTNDAR